MGVSASRPPAISLQRARGSLHAGTSKGGRNPRPAPIAQLRLNMGGPVQQHNSTLQTPGFHRRDWDCGGDDYSRSESACWGQSHMKSMRGLERLLICHTTLAKSFNLGFLICTLGITGLAECHKFRGSYLRGPIMI